MSRWERDCPRGAAQGGGTHPTNSNILYNDFSTPIERTFNPVALESLVLNNLIVLKFCTFGQCFIKKTLRQSTHCHLGESSSIQQPPKVTLPSVSAFLRSTVYAGKPYRMFAIRLEWQTGQTLGLSSNSNLSSCRYLSIFYMHSP